MRLTIDPAGVRVLVVDDEDYITDLVAVGLRFVGFEVETAADGREALAKVVTTRPDLVVLDIAMPGIDGIEVVERLRRDGVATPIVFLTARDAPADRVRAYISAPTTTSQNPSASRSCWRASKRFSVASLRMSVGRDRSKSTISRSIRTGATFGARAGVSRCRGRSSPFSSSS